MTIHLSYRGGTVSSATKKFNNQPWRLHGLSYLPFLPSSYTTGRTLRLQLTSKIEFLILSTKYCCFTDTKLQPLAVKRSTRHTLGDPESKEIPNSSQTLLPRRLRFRPRPAFT
ncbi:hypothetical protein H9L39_10380 [Fusarium oxysporum f. sp. albedinis]|nr:hypothetical protein H9L39_10380 [Fusarium oxysporum f. sp. albedinis]